MNIKHTTSWLLLSILWGFGSCGNTQTQTKSIDTADIEVVVVEKAPEHHPGEDTIIADLPFFISEKDFEKNEKKYLKKITDNVGWYNIGEYGATNASSQFENDSLYYIEFNGHSREIDDYDGRLIPDYKTLLKIYESKYGKPTFQITSIPRPYETNDGYYYELSRWDLGKRSISIRLSAESYGYRINLVIFRNDINNRVKERKQKESKERQESAASVI